MKVYLFGKFSNFKIGYIPKPISKIIIISLLFLYSNQEIKKLILVYFGQTLPPNIGEKLVVIFSKDYSLFFKLIKCIRNILKLR